MSIVCLQRGSKCLLFSLGVGHVRAKITTRRASAAQLKGSSGKPIQFPSHEGALQHLALCTTGYAPQQRLHGSCLHLVNGSFCRTKTRAHTHTHICRFLIVSATQALVCDVSHLCVDLSSWHQRLQGSSHSRTTLRCHFCFSMAQFTWIPLFRN